jgi:hypothetical protein
MDYGRLEYAYAAPFVDRVTNDTAFKAWVLRKTEFSEFAADARLLHEEMRARRSGAKTWWRSHYTERCRCYGCSGQETDMLSIFEAQEQRFALHVEVKHPNDRFKDGQGKAYTKRAECWTTVGHGPRSLIPHTKASTVVLYSELRRFDYASEITYFGCEFTFEEIKKEFPDYVVSYETLG